MATQTDLEKLKAFNDKQRQKDMDALPIEQRPHPTDNEILEEKARVKTPKEVRDDETERIRLEQEYQANHLQQVTDATATMLGSINNRVNPVKNWIASQPTPGGIMALLLFIGFFALAAIPVNQQGQTRLYLLWQTILNRTHMLYRENTAVGANNPNYGGGAGGSFGGGGGVRSETDVYTPNGNTPIDITHLNLFPGF